MSIVDVPLRAFVAPLRLCANIFFNVWNVAIERECIAFILLLRIVEIGKRCMRRQQIIRLTFISSEFDLPRSVRSQHLVEPKVEFFIAKLRNYRRQVNRAAVTNARLRRHSSERRNLDRAPSQGFYVEPQQELT